MPLANLIVIYERMSFKKVNVEFNKEEIEKDLKYKNAKYRQNRLT